MRAVSRRLLDRVTRATRAAEEAGLAGILVTPSADLVYLAGYDPPPLERPTCLVLRPGTEPVLLVPELEGPRARGSPLGGSLEVRTWPDGDDPYRAMARLLPEHGTVGASDRMWSLHLLFLQREAPELGFVPASGVLGPLRAVKDEGELDILGRAARATDEAFRRIARDRIEGLREEEVGERLAGLLREQGLDGVNFTIVASGPNGASPHHEPGGRALRQGDAVVLDLGGRVGGYCSDLSRTVCVDHPPRGFREVYDLVQEAQEAAFGAVAPGVPAEEVDRAARDVIGAGGHGDRFIHRTGHGIGLEEHEGPYIVEGNREPLRPGMCFSIEPGIYVEGAFGVRIEDIVAVTDTGAIRLNHATRDLELVT
ncbi:MAG: aminopeptidase P family protein [Actinobacteria bacterium]|nr:aminopeptidase P family protein [Actinomycetota bacterium]